MSVSSSVTTLSAKLQKQDEAEFKKLPTPREISAILDEYVIGQQAKQVLSVASTTTTSSTTQAKKTLSYRSQTFFGWTW